MLKELFIKIFAFNAAIAMAKLLLVDFSDLCETPFLEIIVLDQMFFRNSYLWYSWHLILNLLLSGIVEMGVMLIFVETSIYRTEIWMKTLIILLS